MQEIKFRCCFCNKTIESSKTDPADVNILINIDKPRDQQYSQNFYCHVICFKEKLHDKIKPSFYMLSILGD